MVSRFLLTIFPNTSLAGATRAFFPKIWVEPAQPIFFPKIRVEPAQLDVLKRAKIALECLSRLFFHLSIEPAQPTFPFVGFSQEFFWV